MPKKRLKTDKEGNFIAPIIKEEDILGIQKIHPTRAIRNEPIFAENLFDVLVKAAEEGKDSITEEEFRCIL